MSGGDKVAPGGLRLRVGVHEVLAIIVLIALAYATPVLWFVWPIETEEDREVARIIGPASLEIVILDTSRGATTGFAYVVDIVESGKPGDRDAAVAFLADAPTVQAIWDRSSVVVCADDPRIIHYQNFYEARIGDDFLSGEVLLRSLEECGGN